MLSNYSVMLLGNVRGRDELEIVLNKTGKETEEKYEQLARLDMAIRYQEKPVNFFQIIKPYIWLIDKLNLTSKFVAHPNCQQKLVEIWYTGVRRLSKMNTGLTILLMFCFSIFIPVGCIVFILAPNSKVFNQVYFELSF